MVLTSAGCVGMVANLIHVAKGNRIPAEYDGLTEKKVAVVCVAESESFGPSPIAPQIAKQVSSLLQENVDEITLVDQQKIEDWIDRNDWDRIDFVAIGRAVKADSVVAINVDGFSLNDGKTMFKGRSDLSVVVYDVATKKEAFSKSLPEVEYPRNSVFHTTDMSKREFRRRFLTILSHRVARAFYPYDMEQDFAQDATVVAGI